MAETGACGVPLGSSHPGVPLASILRTEELRRRPSRPPEFEKENGALTALVSALADSPRTILQTLADTVLEVLRAGSAGLSLLTNDETRFCWAAIAGAWGPHIGGGTPRTFGPCGDVLDHNTPMLFTHWERRYPYLTTARPLAHEGLLVPFYVSGKGVGTIWAIAHDKRRRFDAEDLRLLESMGRFASAAYQAVESIEHLTLEIAAREKAESTVHQLASDLEQQVQVRTRALELSTRELLASNTQLEREIAERKRAEQELRRSEAFLAQGQHLSHIGTCSWRAARDEVTWSEQLYRIYGLEIGVPVTLDLIRARVHPEDVGLLEKMKVVDQAGAGNGFEWQYRLIMPDHAIKYLHAVVHATQEQDGQLEYIAAVQDVTGRRLSEEALDKARAQLTHVARITSLGVLAASIAHELNQPLSGIITNANTCLRMLAADSPDVDGARETARRTIRDANRASDVIARLRALFTRRESTTELLDLNEATREVVALSSSELQRHGVIVRQDLADDLPLVVGDRVQLQQVILNLLLNASDAMSGIIDDRPRQAVISTARDDCDFVRVVVQDAGVGFAAETADKLFDAFYTTKRRGMGMGLSVSRSIIERHHGRIWAAGNDGPGATFSFSIPGAPERRPEPALVMRNSSWPSLR